MNTGRNLPSFCFHCHWRELCSVTINIARPRNPIANSLVSRDLAARTLDVMTPHYWGACETSTGVGTGVLASLGASVLIQLALSTEWAVWVSWFTPLPTVWDRGDNKRQVASPTPLHSSQCTLHALRYTVHNLRFTRRDCPMAHDCPFFQGEGGQLRRQLKRVLHR